jgi:two-component system chemotaxis response regulator CheY
MGIRVLIVDDSSTIRLIVRRCLEQAELGVEEILEASNGEEALVVLAKQTVDVVFSDINMPRMDGIQTPSNLGRFKSRITRSNFAS